jgi:hypothetical protein
VEIGTVGLLTLETLSTGMNLIVQRMIFLFFPAMGKFTTILIFAAISVSLHKMLSFPLRALLLFVIENVRLSSEILPIMSIYTCISRMLSVRIWTPNSLEMKHVEVR